MKSILRAGLAVAALTGTVALFSVHTAAPADGQAPALADRVAQLEERMAALEARVAALDGTGGTAAAQPAPAAAAQTVLMDVSGQSFRTTERFDLPSSAIQICWEVTGDEGSVHIVLYRVTEPTLNLSHTGKAGETRCVNEPVSPGRFYLMISPSNSNLRFRVWAMPA